MRDKTIKPKIRFFTTKIVVYYSKLTKILNGKLNENYLITTKIVDYYKQLTKIIFLTANWTNETNIIDTTKIVVYYKQLAKIIFNDNVDNIARKSYGEADRSTEGR